MMSPVHVSPVNLDQIIWAEPWHLKTGSYLSCNDWTTVIKIWIWTNGNLQLLFQLYLTAVLLTHTNRRSIQPECKVPAQTFTPTSSPLFALLRCLNCLSGDFLLKPFTFWIKVFCACTQKWLMDTSTSSLYICQPCPEAFHEQIMPKINDYCSLIYWRWPQSPLILRPCEQLYLCMCKQSLFHSP